LEEGAKLYLEHFLKRKKRLRTGEQQPPGSSQQNQMSMPGGQSGGQNPHAWVETPKPWRTLPMAGATVVPKPPPQKIIPQPHRQPTVLANNQRVVSPRKKKKGHLNTQSKRAAKTSTKAEGREVAALQFTIAQLRENLQQKDKEIKVMKEMLKQIGLSAIDQYKTEIDALKEQLKNSKPIEIIDIELSSGDDSLEGKPPSKRRKSNLAIALKQTHQVVKVKEEAIQRAAAAEASVEAARREEEAVEATLRDVQEDLEDANEVVAQQTLTTDIWQGRFDEVFELAHAAGVDGKTLSEIRFRPLSNGS
jgi:DNA-binding winged helix-turn-helix (wHTH) protein